MYHPVTNNRSFWCPFPSFSLLSSLPSFLASLSPFFPSFLPSLSPHQELCIRSYSSQLARIHIEHYLYQLLQSMPETRDLQEDAPVTSALMSLGTGWSRLYLWQSCMMESLLSYHCLYPVFPTPQQLSSFLPPFFSTNLPSPLLLLHTPLPLPSSLQTSRPALLLLHTPSPPPPTPHPPPPPHLQGWVSEAPPGSLDAQTEHLRDCISVLFMFERKPTRDKSFSEDCRQWLNLLVSQQEIMTQRVKQE